MPRLIDVDEIKLPQGFFEKVDNVPKFYKWLDEQPTVDAEPVRHGHWIGESQTKLEKLFFPSRVFKCSVCGNFLDFDGVNAGRGSANYCPNCGAKMDEVEDEE